MGRKTTSNSSILLAGIGITVLAAILGSAIGGTFYQWLFIPPMIMVSLWTASAINRRNRNRGG